MGWDRLVLVCWVCRLVACCLVLLVACVGLVRLVGLAVLAGWVCLVDGNVCVRCLCASGYSFLNGFVAFVRSKSCFLRL